MPGRLARCAENRHRLRELDYNDAKNAVNEIPPSAGSEAQPEVARLVGFGSREYLAATVKSELTLTPRQYCKRTQLCR